MRYLLLTLTLMALAIAGPLRANTQAEALAKAMEAVRAKNWDSAQRLARQGGAEAVSVVEWHRLRASEGSFNDTLRFLSQHGDWPGLKLLRRRSEQTIPDNADPRQVIDFFRLQPPQTGEGALQLVAAYQRQNQQSLAQGVAVEAWRTLPMEAAVEQAFLRAFPTALGDHHQTRADMLMWRGEVEGAVRMRPYLGEEYLSLADARIGLRRGDNGVDQLVSEVVRPFKDDPGLGYERFLWRLNKGNRDGALQMLNQQSASPKGLGQPERWASWRRIFARQQMRLGNAKFAYDIATRHYLTEGSHFADLEWLAGYIALRKLNDPFAAIFHFENFRGTVASPISLGRAGYWLGRAYEAQGNTNQARKEYTEAAKHQTSFYGQLAAEKLGLPMDDALVGRATAPDWRNAAFTQSTVFKAGVVLLQAGELSLSERFLRHLAETQDPTALAQLGRFAIESGEPHLAVMLGKQAVTEGTVLPGPYYALHPVAQDDYGVPRELVLAIARRESEFDPSVVSGVGARGLMQLMPGTAQEMARDLGVSYNRGRLLTDWKYNATLGAAYLRELTEEFGNSPVLISVAYNAGPSRARSWINTNGDPRSGRIDVVDWIEHIPFRETRNYVMRVTESLPIYRARIAGRPVPLTLNKDLIGAMPGPTSSTGATLTVSAAPVRSLRPVARGSR